VTMAATVNGTGQGERIDSLSVEEVGSIAILINILSDLDIGIHETEMCPVKRALVGIGAIKDTGENCPSRSTLFLGGARFAVSMGFSSRDSVEMQSKCNRV
jgi:hypothetical protein